MRSSHPHPSWSCFLSYISSLFLNGEVQDAKKDKERANIEGRYEYCDKWREGWIMMKGVHQVFGLINS